MGSIDAHPITHEPRTPPMSPALVPDPAQLRLVCLTASDAAITMVVCTKAAEAPCPRCGQASHRAPSRSQRTRADLPWNGLAVPMRRQSHRFFCDNRTGEQGLFTARIPTVAAPYARRTTRLAAWFTQVAFALGGVPGARLLRHSGCAISRQTLLRQTLLRQTLLRQLRSFPVASGPTDRKSTRLNSSHTVISYAVFCLQKKKK